MPPREHKPLRTFPTYLIDGRRSLGLDLQPQPTMPRHRPRRSSFARRATFAIGVAERQGHRSACDPDASFLWISTISRLDSIGLMGFRSPGVASSSSGMVDDARA